MRLERLGWVRRQSFGTFLAAPRCVSDVHAHFGPIDGHAGTLAQFDCAFMHLDQITEDGCADALQDDDTGSNHDHVIGFIDGQPVAGAPVRSEGRLEVALLVGEAGQDLLP